MIDIINSINQYQGSFYNVDNNGLLQSRKEAILYDNEQNQIAQKASTDLMAAINQLDINEDYRYVKDELFNELDGIINSTLQNYGGNLRYAINNIQSMSRDILSSPKITGLVETNQQYKKWKAEIEGRKDISDDIKVMYIDKNPYNFELIYRKDGNGNEVVDEEGNKEIIGYKDWKSNKNPVKQMNLNDIVSTGLKYLTTTTTNINGIDTTTLSKEDIISALNTAFDAEPNMKASILQDYEVEVWKYNQVKNNGDTEAINNFKELSPFIDDNGNPITPKEYVNTIFNSIGETYSFTNKTSKSSVSNTSSSNGGNKPGNPKRSTPAINQGYIKTSSGDDVIDQKSDNDSYVPL